MRRASFFACDSPSVQTRLDFIFLVGKTHPSHRTFCRFRQRHLQFFWISLSRWQGLVTLHTVAVDGTKMRANKSKLKGIRYGFISRKEGDLRAELEAWVAQVVAMDEMEDALYGDAPEVDLSEWDLASPSVRAALEADIWSSGRARPRHAPTPHIGSYRSGQPDHEDQP